MNAQKIRRILIIIIFIAAAGNFVYQMFIREKAKPAVPVSSGVREGSLKASAPTSMITFTDSLRGYRLNYPDSWSLTDHSGGDGLIRADIADRSVGGVQVRVQSARGLGLEEFARGYLEKYREEMLSHWKGDIGLIGEGAEKIGKAEGYHAAMMHNRPDQSKWFLKLFIWIRGDEAFILQCGAVAGQIHVFEPLFDRCASSFRFL